MMKLLDIFKPKIKFKKYDEVKHTDISPVWFEWVYECEKLPDAPPDRKILTDKAWKRCFDRGMTPKEAVAEYLKQSV